MMDATAMLLLSVLLLGPRAVATAPAKPNVLYVVIDGALQGPGQTLHCTAAPTLQSDGYYQLYFCR